VRKRGAGHDGQQHDGGSGNGLRQLTQEITIEDAQNRASGMHEPARPAREEKRL